VVVSDKTEVFSSVMLCSLVGVICIPAEFC
jgi:hypothetical protein